MKHLILVATLAACTRTVPEATTTTPVEPVADLAERRAQLLGYLDEYTKRGEFPTDENGLPISVFVDAKGVRCPMAELIFRSGHPELVNAVFVENNTLQLADVHDGPLHDWMLGSGLTREEIVMIQGAPRELDLTFELPRNIERPNREIITAQRARVRGRLEMAQAALRKDQRQSLLNASAALPAHRIPEIRRVRPVIARGAR